MKARLYEYFSTQSGAMTLEDILISFLVALILGMAIYFSYRFSFSGAVYSVRFNVSLVMLTLITTLVMSVIGNNIALSLGMVGALSIVRFRTAIKDPRDTAFIFWGIAIGICCGVSEFLIAMIGTVVIFLFLILIGAVKNNDRYLLIIRSEKSSSLEIEKAISHYFTGKARIKVMNAGAKELEYIYEISERLIEEAQKKNSAKITDVIYGIEGIQTVSLVSQNDELNR